MSQPNVLWITVDSLRNDHTSLGGASQDVTPNLQRIADSTDGTAFSRCISHSEWTRSSVSSILTGVHPANHGVGMEKNRAVPDSIRSVATRFRDQGYRTACLSENPLIGPELGLTRGFDRAEQVNLGYRNLLEGLRAYPKTYGKYLIGLQRHSSGFTRGVPHSSTYLIGRLAQKWLRGFRDENNPFFMYVHFNGPHRPYYPANAYYDEFTDALDMSPEAAREFSYYVHQNLYRLIADGSDLTEDEWEALRAMYRGEIRHVDEEVGKLYNLVRDRLGETIVVVTSDHGELFGEHDLLAHKIVLHDAIVHVPLLTSGFDSVVHQSDKLVQHIDLMRTILEQVGGDTEEIQGRDLRESSREYAVSQRGPMGYQRDVAEFESYNPEFDTSPFHDGTLTALRTDQEKLLVSDSKRELVDLSDEYTDVSGQRLEQTDRLESKLQQWRQASIEQFEASETELTGELDQQLSDLGYLA